MNELQLRPYREADFDRACSIRNLESEESRERFRKGLSSSGTWGEHYLHLAIDLDGELVGDVQLRKCDATRPQGAWEMGLDLEQRHLAWLQSTHLAMALIELKAPRMNPMLRCEEPLRNRAGSLKAF